MLGEKPTRGARRGVYQSRKTNSSQHHESFLEKMAFVRMEADPRVSAYFAQLFTLQYVDKGEARESTPDILVEMDTDKVVVEVKPRSELKKAEVARKLAITRHLLAQLGKKYIVLTDEQIYSEPALENSLIISRYRWWQMNPEALANIVQYSDSFYEITAGDLLKFISDTGEDAPHFLLTMMAQDYFDFDISRSLNVELMLRFKRGAK